MVFEEFALEHDDWPWPKYRRNGVDIYLVGDRYDEDSQPGNTKPVPLVNDLLSRRLMGQNSTEYEEKALKTYVGMCAMAGSGPKGKTCGDCNGFILARATYYNNLGECGHMVKLSSVNGGTKYALDYVKKRFPASAEACCGFVPNSKK